MTCGVYSIIAPNGHKYIGSSTRIERRFYEHQCSDGKYTNQLIKRAQRKYKNLIYQIIIECEPEDLILCEQVCINYFKPEYNISPTAGNCLGTKHTEESKKNMSKAHQGHQHTEATKIKMSTSRTGMKHTPEWIENRAKKLRGKKRSEEFCKRMSEMKKALHLQKNGIDNGYAI